MDDEIDIDEHDILEHPQVKALFPDLSKIQIHLQSSGAEASFLDEPTNPELENLLEERLEYDNGFEDIIEDDLSRAAQEYENEEHFADKNSGDKVIDKNDKETHEISDSETDELQAVVIDSELGVRKNDTELYINDIQVISEDESDELQNVAEIEENKKTASKIDEAKVVMDLDSGDIPRTHEVLECNNQILELTANIHQISDDEDQDTNAFVFIEDTSKTVRLFEDAPKNVEELMKNTAENIDGFEELPECSDDFIEEILGRNTKFIGPVVENDNVFEEITENDTEFIGEGPKNGDGFIEEVLENGNRLIEHIGENSNEFIEEIAENEEFTGENPENKDGFIDESLDSNDAFNDRSPENDEEVSENDDSFIEETLEENDEIIEETQEFSRVQESIQNESLDIDTDMQNPDIDDDSKYQQISIKEEIEYDPEISNGFEETLPEETYNNDELPPEDIYHFKNKIILGSKPSPNTQGNLNIINENSYLVVLLDDWSVHLDNSPSYCSDCRTLFTTPNALDAHRMTAHSLLAPIITNRAVKSTALSSANVAKKSTANKNDNISNSTYCNHCNVTFKDHTTLIKHLYELLPAKQHTCNICDVTFKNQNDLVNHNVIHIKMEPPRKYLKAKKSADNPILREMLSAKRDPNKLKRCLTVENIANKQTCKVKPVKIKKEPKEDESTKQCRYKCLICSDIFDSYNVARGHRIAHPETPLNELLKKLPNKRTNPNNSKDNLTYEDDDSKAKKEKESFQLIPTSALFQCSKCDIHFTTALAGQAHFSGNKCNEKGKYGRAIWSCPTCKKKLRKVDENSHKKQHEISNKIKIYKITKNTYERALCKCLNCNVYFEYILLMRHFAKCGKIPTAKCKICDILFPSHKLPEHVRKHDVMKLKKKDFILVDYADTNDKSKAIKKSSTAGAKTNPLLAKKIKQEPKVTIKTEPEPAESTKIVNKLQFEREKHKLYFCKHCKSFLSRRSLLTSIKLHSSKKCIKNRKYTFSNCPHCGLRIFGKARLGHERLHTRKKLTINNFEFYDSATLKRITPPIPKYPRCDKCQIHFLHRNSIRNHICGEDYENCEICADKFENSALVVHLQIHRVFSAPPKPATSRPKIIPELMMKYESLNAIWNILFICGKCDLVTDLYNKAVEHSQSHLKQDPQPSTIKCYICNLKFEESCWSKHSELHSRMTLVYKDFKILKYAPENLLDESWFQMFETLPEKDIRQIIDRSVFGSERSLKMRLIKDGLPEFTVYCCSNCHVSYDNNDILNHVRAKCNASTHICKGCGLAFDSAATLEFHNQLHMKGIKQEEFRIVHFVKPNDTKQASNKDKPKAKVVIKKPEIKAKNKTTEKNAQFVLYKCNECTVCVHMKHNQNYHICASDHHIVFCKICKQNFSYRQKTVHAARHNTYPEFRAKNIKVMTFEPMPEGVDKPTYYNKRKKGSKSATNKHGKKVNPIKVKKEQTSSEDSEIESESTNSPQCSSVNGFESLDTTSSKTPTKSKARTTLNSSSRNLLSIESNDTEQTKDKKTAKLYKCDCGLHYTSLKSVEKHIETCDSSDKISKENCSKCGLLFPTDILVSHLCKHHSQNTKLTVEEMHRKSNAAEVSPTQKKPNTSVSDGIKLYKCSECNVYFLNQSSCYKHISKHVPLDPKEYIECKMCCLQFRILSLHIHMRKHHEKEFKLEKVLVEEYQPSVGKQAPKIDIYFANDRLQNVQVSSSND